LSSGSSRPLTKMTGTSFRNSCARRWRATSKPSRPGMQNRAGPGRGGAEGRPQGHGAVPERLDAQLRLAQDRAEKTRGWRACRPPPESWPGRLRRAATWSSPPGRGGLGAVKSDQALLAQAEVPRASGRSRPDDHVIEDADADDAGGVTSWRVTRRSSGRRRGVAGRDGCAPDHGGGGVADRLREDLARVHGAGVEQAARDLHRPADQAVLGVEQERPETSCRSTRASGCSTRDTLSGSRSSGGSTGRCPAARRPVRTRRRSPWP